MVSDEIVKLVGIVIIVVVSIIVFVFLMDRLTGGTLIKSITAGALFWLPFAPLAMAFTKVLSAIPI
ncbi:MAG: hypothetical protein ACW99A_18270 [Candidatus Kariarchaeaceae archaeon]|jgi:hypothetical protein